MALSYEQALASGVIQSETEWAALKEALNDPDGLELVGQWELHAEWTTADTFNDVTLPPNTKLAKWEVVAGGGGGGSGRKGPGGANRFGGGAGGSGGMIVQEIFSPAALADTYTIVVGAGGTGGASQATNGNDGNAGGNGVGSTVTGAVVGVIARAAGAGGGSSGPSPSSTSSTTSEPGWSATPQSRWTGTPRRLRLTTGRPGRSVLASRYPPSRCQRAQPLARMSSSSLSWTASATRQ